MTGARVFYTGKEKRYGFRRTACPERSIILGADHKEGFGVRADGADLRRLRPDVDMTAVAALPDRVAVAGEDDLALDFAEQLAIPLFMRFFDLRDRLKEVGDAGEALLLCDLREFDIHIRPLIVLAVRSSLEVALDLCLALVEDANDHGPSHLGHDDPDDQEGDECRYELRWLGDQDVGAGSVGNGNIWISYSDDLLNWGGHRPLLKPWTNWNADKIGPTPPIKTKYGWLEIVHGVKERRYSLGAVLLDIDNPAKVIAKAKSPILTPNAPYEYMGHSQAPTVFACGALADEEKDEIRIYYGASDICVGLATGKLSELIDLIKYENANFDDWRWS